MIKLGQIYINKLSHIEYTVIAIHGQKENDCVILKFYTTVFGTLYVSHTVKDIEKRCILKEEIK